LLTLASAAILLEEGTLWLTGLGLGLGSDIAYSYSITSSDR